MLGQEAAEDAPTTSRNLAYLDTVDLIDESESVAPVPSTDSDDEVLLKMKARISLRSKKKKKLRKVSGVTILKDGTVLSDNTDVEVKKEKTKIRKEKRNKKNKKELKLSSGSILRDGTFLPDRESQELEIAQLKNCLQNSQRKLDRLERDVAELNEKYSGFLNPDQIRFISKRTANRWGADTVLKAFKLFVACGPEGYFEIKRQHLPYPSIRTLGLVVDNFDEDE